MSNSSSRFHSLLVRSARSVPLILAAWYLLSLVTLWTNRYIVAGLLIDSNVLSLAQLGVSVVCGLGSEVQLVGWTRCKQGIKRVLQDGVKDMVLLGSVRIITLLCGLTALKYISVSFSQTIKSAAPFFTSLLTYMLLAQPTGWRVNLSLVPIVLGLAFCSFSDASFNMIGFVAAVMANCMDCLQNVMTKKFLSRSYTTTQLQLYTGVIAMSMQLGYLIYASLLPHNALFRHDEAPSDHPLSSRLAAQWVLLTLAGVGFYLQSSFAYILMSLVSPVTYSVANCVKRALLIVLSVWFYGNPVMPLNWFGTLLVITGVYVYSEASRWDGQIKMKTDTTLPMTQQERDRATKTFTSCQGICTEVQATRENRIQKGAHCIITT